MEFDRLCQLMVERQASDLFLKVGTPPFLRIEGALQPYGADRLTRPAILHLTEDLLGPERRQLFQAQRELNFAFERPGIGRFRANVLWQRGSIALVIRRVQHRIPDFDTLRLPAGVLRRFAAERQGLVLVTGPTGSGKSTTAAAILEHLNHTEARHIVTLEDPIEFQFEEDRAIINQREVGVDTKSFSEGLKNVLRQSPDVLFVSDIRDRETMEAALLAAESGQLVLSCVHTTNVLTTLERVVAMFPPHQQTTIRFRLSLILKGIVCLRLLPQRDGHGQVPACEILVMTPTIRELLREGKLEQIPALLRDGATDGMQTMTQALYGLVKQDLVTVDAARAVADSPGELQLALREIRGIKDAV